MSSKTHARRDESAAAMPPELNLLGKGDRKALAEQFARLQSPDSAAEAREKLTTLLLPLLTHSLTA